MVQSICGLILDNYVVRVADGQMDVSARCCLVELDQTVLPLIWFDKSAVLALFDIFICNNSMWRRRFNGNLIAAPSSV